MELGHLLARSGLTYPEVSSKVYHDPSVSWGVVFHYHGLSISRHSVYMLYPATLVFQSYFNKTQIFPIDFRKIHKY